MIVELNDTIPQYWGLEKIYERIGLEENEYQEYFKGIKK